MNAKSSKFISKVLVMFFLAVVFFQGVVTVEASSSLKVSGHTYPQTLTVGDFFPIKGTVSSNYNIVSLTAGVYNSSGKKQFEQTVQPKKKTYDLKGVDAAMTFNTLSAGTYTYKVVARDAFSLKDKVLINKTFKVTVSSGKASTLKVSDYTYPNTLTVGDKFVLKGTVSSNYKITSLTAGIYNSIGSKSVMEKIVNPNSTKYDLKGIDAAMKFDTLAAGTYIYRVVAKDASSKKLTLINKKFTVKKPEYDPSVIESAWFPVSTMKLTQVAYETYSHGNQNAIDCVGANYAFAPFTGKIVAIGSDYNTVYFQSLNKVHYADGTTDYMTVKFLHGSNFSELKKYYENGTIIKQGTDFYKIGGKGPSGPNQYALHYHIEVIKGKVSSGGGNVYAYDAFYINKDKTTSIINKGLMEKQNKISNGGPSDWNTLWRTLIVVKKIAPKFDFLISTDFIFE